MLDSEFASQVRQGRSSEPNCQRGVNNTKNRPLLRTPSSAPGCSRPRRSRRSPASPSAPTIISASATRRAWQIWKKDWNGSGDSAGAWLKPAPCCEGRRPWLCNALTGLGRFWAGGFPGLQPGLSHCGLSARAMAWRAFSLGSGGRGFSPVSLKGAAAGRRRGRSGRALTDG
jgi:hypothetical protein